MTGKRPEEIALLNMSWPEFFEKVQHHTSFSERVCVLCAARALFREHESLAVMPADARKHVAGFVETAKVPWRWFGSMRGAGKFKQLINNNSADLSAALDQIPANDRVRREHYEAFISRYKAAFLEGSDRPYGHGLATATRLLTMKRPDHFVCIDGANRAGLAGEFGVTIHRHNYDEYWDSIIEPASQSRWWNSCRPQPDQERQVWDGRAAFIDALYYVPVQNAV